MSFNHLSFISSSSSFGAFGKIVFYDCVVTWVSSFIFLKISPPYQILKGRR